jgi:thiamine-phosphate pyrophosphorylase
VPGPRLYLITDRRAVSRPLTQVVARALEGAAGQAHLVAVQLREKDLDARALTELARELRAITRTAGASLFVNDRVDVALAVEADGVHLGGGALPVAQVRALSPSLRVALSTHSLPEIDEAARLRADFVVFGPVFETPSKLSLGFSSQGLPNLQQACARGVDVVALGGVDPTRTPDCLHAGAVGVACIRAVMCAEDPANTVAAFLRR